MAAMIFGILASVLGGIGILSIGFVLGPIAVLFGLLAVLIAFVSQSTTMAKIWSVVGLVLGLVACATSPILLAIIWALFHLEPAPDPEAVKVEQSYDDSWALPVSDTVVVSGSVVSGSVVSGSDVSGSLPSLAPQGE
jgi:hypothetical protein